MQDKTFMTLMRLLPKSALSHVVGWATRLPAPPSFHQVAMRRFAKSYRVDVAEAEHGIEGYPTFSEFFARGLKPGSRQVDPGERVVVSPVDGAVSQAGYTTAGQCVQAKGIQYPVARLLDSDEAAKPFEGGAFATLYLSPRDYHRIHAPLGGTIDGYSYVPGAFWPVNRASVTLKDQLFCVNERLITYLTTPLGKCAVVKVGATCVSRIRASYANVVTHQGERGRVRTFETPIPVQKGDELGRFEMGSTVILLFQPGRMTWDESLLPETVVRMGARIGVGS